MGYNYNLVCLLSALITHEGLLGTAEVLASNGGWIDVPEPVGRMVLYFHVRFQKYGFMGLEIHLYRYTYHMYIFICLRIRKFIFLWFDPISQLTPCYMYTLHYFDSCTYTFICFSISTWYISIPSFMFSHFLFFIFTYGYSNTS